MDVDIDNILDERDVMRRVPEINNIEDRDLRMETVNSFVEYCPDYFWTVKGSTYHHPIEHRKNRGLWLHTKRAFTVYSRLSDSYRHQGLISDHEQDCGRAAILLHDMFKYGWPKQNYTVDDHDVIAGDVLEGNMDLPDKVIGCVRSHNGPWYEGRSPRTDLEQVHHLSDMGASDVNIGGISIKEPCQELKKSFPDISKSKR